jgi:tetrahydromethanopterin S-methyltransferase subunit F
MNEYLDFMKLVAQFIIRKQQFDFRIEVHRTILLIAGVIKT